MSQQTGRPEDPTRGRGTDDLQRRRAPARGSYDDDFEDDLDDDDRPRGFGATVLAGIKELVIVSKLTPGPFDLRRGDVVVFEDPGTPQPWLEGLESGASTVGGPFHEILVFVGLLPEGSENHLIKRVIGLPGDRVQSDGGTGPIRVNGVPVTEPYVKPGDAPSEKKFDITVPAGHVWVMGDHRSDSSDSRYHDDGTGATGSVPIDKLVGRALFIVWPIDHVTWLGVPERTFAQVPAPASTPAVTPSGSTTPPATTKAPAS